MKKMFCVACNMVVAKAAFALGDLECEVVLKANRLIATGKAEHSDAGPMDLDSATKIAVNRALSEVIATQNLGGEVVCPTCYEGVLIAGEELAAPKETKEERQRRTGLSSELPMGHLTSDYIRKQIQALDGQIAEEKTLSKDNIATIFKINRYYISVDAGVTWKEVSLSSYATAERKAGHMADLMKGPIATTSFEHEGVCGKVVKPPREIK